MRLSSYMMAAALLGLSACGGGGGDNQASPAKGDAPTAAEIRLQPGEWEMTHEIISMESPNMPKGAMAAMAGQKTTFRNCVTPEQAAKPNADFFADKESGCSYKDFTMAGGRIRGVMTCAAKAGPGSMTMAMNGRYSDQSYQMEVEMKSDAGGGSMTMKSRGSGKRIGECPAGQKS